MDSRILPGVGLAARYVRESRSPARASPAPLPLSTGLLTLLIACLGIFGMVSYGATLRVKEFGIHIALGAEASSVVLLAVRQIVWPVAIGMVLGVAAAGPIGMALTSGPIQLQAADPAAYVGALLLFVTAAVIAALLPAIRVIKADPIQALRHS